jgi:hypothetical protein
VTIKAMVSLERDGWIDEKPMRFYATMNDDGAMTASVNGCGNDKRSIPYTVKPETMQALFDAITQLIDEPPVPSSGDPATAEHGRPSRRPAGSGDAFAAA